MTDPGVPVTVDGTPRHPALVLMGAPGSGKSTVGRLLAARLGCQLIDVDHVIEEATGMAVQEIFTSLGEPEFRRLEVEHTLAVLRQPAALVSLGGGAVMTPQIRAALQPAADAAAATERSVVIWLRVSAGQAAQRVGLNTARPLLLGNVRSTLVKLLNERSPVYESLADVTIDTDDNSPQQLVEQIQTWLEHSALWPEPPPGPTPASSPADTPTEAGEGTQDGGVRTIQVRGPQPYPVIVGHGVVDRVAQFVRGASRIAVIHTASTAALAAEVGRAATSVGTDAGTAARVIPLEVPDAEAAKSVATLAACWDRLAEEGFTRSDLIIGVGGGATTDLAGFVAATWLRGVGFVTVPSTVLGMVDAAVGGKTGINLNAGKNLVGAFHEPRAVVVDLDVLATLPVDDLRAGLAEVIKTGFIADPVILELVESQPQQALQWDSDVLAELITRSITVKARVVAEDLTESTSVGAEVGRELLNYGHTLAHAIERREHYRWRHGDAVSVGVVYAAELARAAGRLDDATADRHRRVLELVGLPTRYDPDAFDELVATMALDKKARGNQLRFVTLTGIGQAEILAGPSPQLLRSAYDALVG